MILFYFLNPDYSYRPCKVNEWAEQFEKMDRLVAENEINDFRVSTVWLGTNHSLYGEPPLLFETMVFYKSGCSVYTDRYTTWEEAVEGHKIVVELVLDGFKKDDTIR